jgi:hypothetical protein
MACDAVYSSQNQSHETLKFYGIQEVSNKEFNLHNGNSRVIKDRKAIC